MGGWAGRVGWLARVQKPCLPPRPGFGGQERSAGAWPARHAPAACKRHVLAGQAGRDSPTPTEPRRVAVVSSPSAAEMTMRRAVDRPRQPRPHDATGRTGRLRTGRACAPPPPPSLPASPCRSTAQTAPDGHGRISVQPQQRGRGGDAVSVGVRSIRSASQSDDPVCVRPCGPGIVGLQCAAFGGPHSRFPLLSGPHNPAELVPLPLRINRPTFLDFSPAALGYRSPCS